MSTTQQPEALRLADILQANRCHQFAAELRRLHSENETLRVERERNLDSIQVSNEIINKKNAENAALQQGYAAARLEIESLRGRSVPVSEADMVLAAMETGEWELQRLLPQTCFTSDANIRHAWSVKRGAAPYCTEDGLRVWTGATPLEALRNGAAALGVKLPGCSETAALPEPDTHCFDDDTQKSVWSYSEGLMRSILASDRAMRAAQPAGAQQPAIMPKGESAAAQLRAMATNYPAGHLWDKLDAKACIRGALEIEALRASHGQAPAQDANEYLDLLAQCRSAFQIPERGDPLEVHWAAAMADPGEVPGYLQEIAARHAAKAAPAVVAGPSDDALRPAVEHAHEILRRLMYHRDGEFFINVNRRGAEALHVSTIATIAHAALAAAPTTQPAPQQEAQEPHGWLYDWTHSSATGKPDATYTAFTPDEAHARKHDNCRAVYTAPQPSPTPQADSQQAPQQEAQEQCKTCVALARTVMLDQVSFDRKPDCYGIRQITDDESVEEWEDIRTSPDVAREEADDMMATGRGEIYEVVPLWTTPQPTQPQAGAVPASEYPPLPAPAFQLIWDGGRALYKVSKPNIGSAEVFTSDQLRAYVDADRAMHAQAAPAAVAGPSEAVKFTDQSTADPVEKARRYLTAMGDQRTNSAYFYDDGYPRRESAQDALATLAVLEQLAAAPTTQPAPQQEAQEPYSIDVDPQGIRALVADAITGALAFGAQGTNAPPDGHWLAPFWAAARAEREAAPIAGLHPKTAALVQRFTAALAEKLAAAEKKYGYSDGWASPDWMGECRQKLVEHLAKGDPRDVAAYCAFLWHHGESTTAPASQGDALDAARYRFLAAHCRSTSEHWDGRWSIIVDGPEPKSHDSEDDFDAAIDAARKEKS